MIFNLTLMQGGADLSNLEAKFKKKKKKKRFGGSKLKIKK
jgi:hypothetical protein